MNIKSKQEKKYRRQKRIRAKISGDSKIPRLLAVKSNKHTAAQLINDEKGKILAFANDLKIKKSKKTAAAFEVGKLIAEKAKALKIEKVIFDRAGCKYHGRVKALAEGAREGGLKF